MRLSSSPGSLASQARRLVLFLVVAGMAALLIVPATAFAVGYTYEGTVYKPDHTPAPYAEVALYDMSQEPRFALTDAAGHFSFTGLPGSNDYQLFARWAQPGHLYEMRLDQPINMNLSGASVTLAEEPEPAAPRVTRVSGADRFSGAVAIARKFFDTDHAIDPWSGRFGTGVTNVVIASGEDRAAADPLAAAGLCGTYDAPLFLVTSTSVPESVKQAIKEIADASATPVTVWIVGGAVSVPDARLYDLFAAAGPGQLVGKRISGADRYATAAAIAKQMSVESGPSDAVLIANGADPTKFFDALALSPLSAYMEFPILLVSATDIPDATAYALDDIYDGLPAPTVIIGGGPNTVSSEIFAAFYIATGGDTERWAGNTRYETAQVIADNAYADGYLNFDNVGLAAKLPDALTGGAAIGMNCGTLVLTESSQLTASTGQWFANNRYDADHCTIFGGDKSVVPAVATSVGAKLKY